MHNLIVFTPWAMRDGCISPVIAKKARTALISLLS